MNPINDDTRPEGEPEEQRQHVDATMAKRVVRKIDRFIIPVLFVTYMFNFMDRTILSSASVFGLREDTNLRGQQYSWVSSMFYFGYFAWTYPTSLLIARLPVAKYLAINALFWGTVVVVTAACTNFGGLLVVRFLLGIAEATLTPAFMFLTSTWYTRDEIPFRTGIWFAGNSVGGLVGSLLAFGAGHISPDNVVGPWRAMYIILGLGTFVWSFAIFTFLPDRISNARFLNGEERQFAADRVIVAGTGSTEKTNWRLDQVKECFVDPKTWLIFALEVTTQIPNGGTQNFANLVIRSFGFTSLQSTLINIPYSLLAASVIAGTGWLAGRYRTMNCLLIVCVVSPCIIGSAMIYRREHISPSGVHLFAYFLLASGPGAMPLNLSLVQSNYRGVTKKMTVSALVFVAYCAGNIAGPHFFRASEAPTYNTAFRTIMICYSLVVVLALTLRTYLQWQNKKRAREEGFEGSAGGSGVVAGGKVVGAGESSRDVAQMVDQVELRPEDYEDVTDWKTVGFRYRY
ncbi:putative transporter like protein [Verticillium longisporum]|uniref:Putative transporter like protein n=1 Tax=Verticillium longisporum TaxID=100787 RepID=A0A8I3AHN3_VERLO|nr:putative transporter like protein [Verticillium longisporum]KAG7143343.1 putative transporter like protein [Verticillium longisporum]